MSGRAWPRAGWSGAEADGTSNGPPGDKISDHLIAAHNNASIQAKQEGLGKLSGVHWARLDFQEEWQTCARWVLLRSVPSPPLYPSH